jgi:cytidylate kinase
LHRTASISRQQLAFLFWPDSTDQQALKNLRKLLTRLRQALPWAIASIARILAKRGDYKRACAGHQRSLRISWEIGDCRTACLNVADLAAIREREGRADKAESIYRQAIDFGTHLSNPSYLSGMLVSLARFLMTQGSAIEAQKVFESAQTQISSVAGDRLAGEYTETGAEEFSRRYQELTVERLPDPAPLPDVSELITDHGEPLTLTFGLRNDALQDLTIANLMDMINAAYKKGNVVIVDRGGMAALQDKPDILHVRIRAPLALRVKRLMKDKALTEQEAQKRIREHDLSDIDWIKRYFGLDLHESSLFDLISNTEKFTPQDAADLIIKALDILPKTK